MPTHTITSLNELQTLAEKIILAYPSIRIFLLYGDLGTGKTEFAKQAIKALAAEDEATSPSFSLINEYHSPQYGKIYHADFYRINTVEEVYDIGFEEFLQSENYCLIEWPELIETMLTKNYLKIKFTLLKNNFRKISVNLIQYP